MIPRKILLVTTILALSAISHANSPEQQVQEGINAYEKQNYRQAVEWYQQAAGQGNAKVQFNLGEMYAKGEGVKRDYHQAVQWYRYAAEQGEERAQSNLGMAYILGQGVQQDSEKAKEWFGKACDNGSQIGCDNYRIIMLGESR